MPSQTVSRVLRVEFFGIPRIRTGVAVVVLELPAGEVSLGQVLAVLADRFPRLVPDCISGGELGAGFTANVNGERFVRNANETIAPGEPLLFFSTDAGG